VKIIKDEKYVKIFLYNTVLRIIEIYLLVIINLQSSLKYDNYSRSKADIFNLKFQRMK
jgi:hypothetical protein